MLEVNGLGKSYGKKFVLKDVSFSIEKGERVALLGANGSGKTTTINAICNLLQWEEGDILFDNRSIRYDRRYMASIGAVLGGCRNINWRLTVEQNAEYFSVIRGAKVRDIKPLAKRLQTLLGLDAYKNLVVGKLSTGNKQKAALLCSLTTSPRLLLLDEPTLGLDFQTVRDLKYTVLELNAENPQSYLVTSHDLGFIDDICQRVILLDKGMVSFDGAFSELREKMFHYEMRISLDKSDVKFVHENLVPLWGGKSSLVIEGQDIIVTYDDVTGPYDTFSWLKKQKINPRDIKISPLTMELAYQSIINKSIEL